jgi:hypothetical protein
MFPGWAKMAKKRSWEHIENKGPWKGLSKNEAENILKTKQLTKTVGIHKKTCEMGRQVVSWAGGEMGK